MGLVGLEFDGMGLQRVWRPKSNEFPALALKTNRTLADDVHDYLLEVGKSSATAIAKALGINDRSQVSRLLNNDKRFMYIEKHGQSMIYGVRTLHQPMEMDQ